MAHLLSVPNNHTAVFEALSLVTAEGVVIEADHSESNLGDQSYSEVTDVMFDIADSRARGVVSPQFRLDRAIFRALWMLAGEDAVDELLFFFPKLEKFADDGRHLTGSAVGRALQDKVAGATRSQLDGVVERLRRYPTTRRATAVAYRSGDAERQSRDIPCLLSLSWRIRNGRLDCTAVMRANNVVRLMPYNLFEYTLLTECLAASLGLGLGNHLHYVISMHAYAPDSGELVDLAARMAAEVVPPPMPAMPSDPEPFDAARRTFDAVAACVRAAQAGHADVVRDTAIPLRSLNAYWRDLALVVGITCARAVGDHDLVHEMSALLPPWVDDWTGEGRPR